MAEASMAMGLMAWWASACRIGMMHYKTHKLDVILGHWVVGVAGLIIFGLAATGQPAPWLLAYSAAVLFPLIYSFPQWDHGAPDWSLRRA